MAVSARRPRPGGGQHLGGGEPDLDVVLSHFQQTDMFGVVHVDGSFIIGIDPVLQSAPVLSGKFQDPGEPGSKSGHNGTQSGWKVSRRSLSSCPLVQKILGHHGFDYIIVQPK